MDHSTRSSLSVNGTLEYIHSIFVLAQDPSNVKKDLAAKWTPLEIFNESNHIQCVELMKAVGPTLSVSDLRQAFVRQGLDVAKKSDADISGLSNAIFHCLEVGGFATDFLVEWEWSFGDHPHDEAVGETLSRMRNLITLNKNCVYPPGDERLVSDIPTLGAPSVVDSLTTDAAFGKKALVLFLGNGTHPGGDPINVSVTQEEYNWRRFLTAGDKIYLWLVLGYYSEEEKRFNYRKHNRPINGTVVCIKAYTGTVVCITAAPSFDFFKGKMGDGRVPGSQYLLKEIPDAVTSVKDMREYINLETYYVLSHNAHITVFRLAAKFDVDLVVLGLLGCGVFKGQPDIMADGIADAVSSCNAAASGEKVIDVVLAAYTPNKNPGPAVDTYNVFATQFGSKLL